MQKTVLLALSWQTPFLVTSYRNHPWHVGKKEFCYERYWRDQRISGRTAEISRLGNCKGRSNAQKSPSEIVWVRACLMSWVMPCPITNTGCWKVPFELLSLLSSLNKINSGYFLLLSDICFQFGESGGGYIWWSMPRSCAHLWPQKYLTFSIPIMWDGLFLGRIP